ncbi:hypothetical protein CYMTET_30300 [Cymbomonas tetramitiformis]|uniref:Uncharacterized protein n=1 Tax=Cymbomonas tetramitiformis TaxID=36881 RepID=A0AAE0FJK1_9CHLO|nr:hypothetical protein CYMTET_30300 [Cymbomonas tetramitiformis]
MTRWGAEGGKEKAWDDCALEIMSQPPYSEYNTADKKRKWTDLEKSTTEATAKEQERKRAEKEAGEAARQQAHNTSLRRKAKKSRKRGRHSHVGSSSDVGAAERAEADAEIGLTESSYEEGHADPLENLGAFLNSEAKAKHRRIDLEQQRFALEERRFEESKLDAAAKQERRPVALVL